MNFFERYTRLYIEYSRRKYFFRICILKKMCYNILKKGGSSMKLNCSGLSIRYLKALPENKWNLKENLNGSFIDQEYIQTCSSEELYQIIMTIESLLERMASFDPIYLDSLKRAMDQTKRLAPLYYGKTTPLNLDVYRKWYMREKENAEKSSDSSVLPEEIPEFVYKKTR